MFYLGLTFPHTIFPFILHPPPDPPYYFVIVSVFDRVVPQDIIRLVGRHNAANTDDVN